MVVEAVTTTPICPPEVTTRTCRRVAVAAAAVTIHLSRRVITITILITPA